jgi:eukaryotic-like serine/threonine-protein kinase
LPTAASDARMVGKYEILKMLGAGAFASVYAGRDTVSGKSVAIKQIHTPAAQAEADDTSEYTWGMAMGNHPNIVKTFDLVYRGGCESIILEMASGGDMYDRFDGPTDPLKPLQFGTVRKYVSEMAHAIQHLHRNVGVVHADLKLENFLLHNGTVKLCDFGMVGPIGKVRYGNPTGSTPYMAPELFRTQQKQHANLPSFHNNGYALTPALDCWSFGVILYVVLFKGLPWERAGRGEPRFDSFVSRRGVQAAHWPFSLLSRAMVGILASALMLKPKHRAGMDEFIAFFASDDHAWFVADDGHANNGPKDWRMPLLAQHVAQ